MASESKTVEGANLKGKVIKIINLIRNINYKITKKRTKRPIRKKGRYGEPQSLTKALKSPLSRQWLKIIFNELTQLLEFGTFEFLPRNQLPKGRKTLTSRVVYYQKINKEGKITNVVGHWVAHFGLVFYLPLHFLNYSITKHELVFKRTESYFGYRSYLE